jgi:hypothetical protein
MNILLLMDKRISSIWEYSFVTNEILDLVMWWVDSLQNVSLLGKFVCLFCFVLFVMLRSREKPWHPHNVALVVIRLQSPQWVGVHWGGYVMMYRPMLQVLFEYWTIFVKENSTKSKLKKLGKLESSPLMSGISWR